MLRKARYTVLVVVLCLTACSDSTGPARQSSAAGVYTLLTINSHAMPFPLVVLPGYRLEYTSSLLTLRADSTYLERSIVTEVMGGARVDTVFAEGIWLQNNATVTLMDRALTEQIIGAFNNGRLTFDLDVQDSTYHYVYQKNTP